MVIGWLEVSPFLEYPISTYLEKLQDAKIMEEKRNYTYAICNVSQHSHFVFGKMLKLGLTTKERYFDEEHWQPITEEIEKRHIKIDARFLFFDNNYVILEDGYLSRGVFKEILHELLKNVIETIFDLDIRFKRDIEEIKEFLNTAEIITSIQFKNIELPNPIDLRRRKIKNAIKYLEKRNISEMTIKNPIEGLRTKVDDIEGTFELAKEGFADATVEGRRVTGETPRTYVVKKKKRILRKTIDAPTDEAFIENAVDLKRQEEKE